MTRTLRKTSVAVLALAVSVSVAGAASASPTPAPASGSAENARLRLPRPTGPYAVGRSTLHLVDPTRKDPWAPGASARELMLSIYYPALPGPGARARYATTEEVRLFLEDRDLDGVVPAETVSATRTNARVDARPLPGRRPLVVLSPGFSVSRYTLTGLGEELASRGYVVAAVDHAYESVGARFPGGRMLTCLACEKARTKEDFARAAVGRSRDVSFVLDRLTGRRPAWRHAHLIDRRRIGMAGHSLGGTTAASAMTRDPRMRAGVNMDGSFADPVPDGAMGGRPFLMLGTDDQTHRPGGEDETWDRTWRRLDGWRRWLTVAGSDHFTFCDVPVLGDQLGPPRSDPRQGLSGARSDKIVRDYVGAFFDLHLRRVPQPLLDGPSRNNPEVRFHTP
ncbi:alpha/beta hydrolase family protein [Actinomadura kijaniata]|uniref:alpha/beta hydrolase family protein n=1 Tax=Actinomadura kijaniata TaxID=46161 RepID=UPI000835BC11|nr:acetylhydrolase [Actinomadura kijaniata]